MIIKITGGGIYRSINPLAVVTFRSFNYCLGFSTLKQKAEKYLCAAVAYRTLADVDPNQLYCLRSDSDKKNQNIFLKKSIEKNKYELFSLREKVIYNINLLKLDSEQNREQIRKIFEIQHGLAIRQSIKTSRLQQGGKSKSFEQKQNFVFNPTLLFKEFDQKIAQHRLRKIYVGKFGIGKTSNQLLIAHLSHIAFMFQKEGDAAQVQLEALLNKNQQVLKQIIPLTSFEAQAIKNKKSIFLEIVKMKFKKIPFLYLYRFPEAFTSKYTSLNYMGYRMEDFLEYFSEQQLKKLGVAEPILSLNEQKVAELDYSWVQYKTDRKLSTLQKVLRYNVEISQNFLRGLQQQCKQKCIKFVVMIDQTNLLFNNIRIQKELKQNMQKPQSLQKLSLSQQASKVTKSKQAINLSSLYSQILDQMHLALPFANIILIDSVNIQQAQRSKSIYYSHKYGQFFFSKQVSITETRILYSLQCSTEFWQKEMDVAFLFQTEKQIYRILAEVNSQNPELLPQNYLQRTNQLLRQVKTLFHKQMTKRQSEEEKWGIQTRHLFISQCLQSVEVRDHLKESSESILDWLVKPQNPKLKMVLAKKLVQDLKKLKKILSKMSESLYKNYVIREKKKGTNLQTKYQSS